MVCLNVEGQTGKITEHAIATEVFGRPADFDASSDTIVRTQAFRLREKLKKYYQTEGAADPITIDIPKGHYVPSATWRELSGGEATARALPGVVGAKSQMLHFAGLALFGAVVFVLGVVLGLNWVDRSGAS